MKKLPILDMHLEVPSKDGVLTFYTKEDIALRDDEEKDNLVDDDTAPVSSLLKASGPSVGKSMGESSSRADDDVKIL
ncbi:hypothetical protein ACOSQ3_006471 [Xanthoceras sorbifolium]